MGKIDEKVKEIVAKGWENLNRDDLEYLYFEKDMIKTQIAELFGVSFNKVNYKLKKFDLNLRRKVLGDALDYVFEKVSDHLNDVL